MARTQIKLNQLIQDGATSNQVISWNGSAWTPSTITGDGNGIYTGSGVVADGTVATINGDFNMSISGGAGYSVSIGDTLDSISGLVLDVNHDRAYIGNGVYYVAASMDQQEILTGAGNMTTAMSTDSMSIIKTSPVNTGVLSPLTITAKTSHVSGAAATFGTGMLFTAETATVENREIFGIESSWITATDATRTSAIAFRLPSGGTYATRLTLNPTSLVPASTFTIGGTSDLTIGGSTGRAVLQSSGNTPDAILLNVNGLTNSSGITMIGANTFTNAGGAKVGVTVNGSFVPTTGSATWTSMAITPTINQFTGGTGITRGLHINPSLNTPADFRALEIGNTLANTYAIHQSGTSVLNMLGGNTGIGTAPGSEKLRVSGSIRFDLGSDAQGDIFYRDSSGNFVRLPIGTNGHVLTSNGTIPGWAASAGGGNGIYGGNGTIASAAVATVTSGSTFTIDYNGGADAILVDDSNGNVTINAKGASTGTLQVNDVGVALGGAATDGAVYVDDASFALTTADSYTPSTSQNNYAIADGTSIVRLTPSANIDITGISQTTSTNGRLLIIHNISGTYTVTLKNESTSSTAANRMTLGSGEVYDVVLRPYQSHALIYDGTSSRWRSVVSDRNESTPQSINTQTGTSYTLVISDAGKLITLDNGAAITLTVPTNASVAFPIGTHIDLAQLGAGQVTIGGSGVTFRAKNGQKLSGQYAGASIVKIGTDTWLCVGDLTT